MKYILSLVLLLCLPESASASWKTGNDLRSAYLAGNRAFAYGYIFGVLDADPNLQAMLPKGTTGWQLVTVVQSYVYANPQKLHYQASEIVKAAIYVSFEPHLVRACLAAARSTAEGGDQAQARVVCQSVPICLWEKELPNPYTAVVPAP